MRGIFKTQNERRVKGAAAKQNTHQRNDDSMIKVTLVNLYNVNGKFDYQLSQTTNMAEV